MTSADQIAAGHLVVLAALAVIVDPSGLNVVIALRKGEAHLGGFWEFPGGKLEPGESAAHCAVREAKEEVGLSIEIVKALDEIAFTYRDKAVKLFPYICVSEMNEVTPYSSEDARWVPISTLGDYRFPPANDTIIALLQAGESTCGSA